MGGKGPAAAFGLPDAHKAHIASAIAIHRTTLVVTATETGAAAITESMRAFGVPTEAFLPRDTPLVHVHAASGERVERRIAVLTALARGQRIAVVATVAALMQALAPKSAFADMLLLLRVGDAMEPRALIERLVRAGYERTELVEGRGQGAARGDIGDVYPMQSRYPVRIEFFGDEIDQIRSFDPATQRAVEQVSEALLPPAMEAPQPGERIERALKKITGKNGFFEQEQAWSQGAPAIGADVLLPLLYPKTETLIDYLPADAIFVLDDALLLDEAARTEQLRFGELVSAMLERDEGVREQGQLERGAAETLRALDTPRTLLLYTLSRTHPQFSPRETVQFSARSAPQY